MARNNKIGDSVSLTVQEIDIENGITDYPVDIYMEVKFVWDGDGVRPDAWDMGDVQDAEVWACKEDGVTTYRLNDELEDAIICWYCDNKTDRIYDMLNEYLGDQELDAYDDMYDERYRDYR